MSGVYNIHRKRNRYSIDPERKKTNVNHCLNGSKQPHQCRNSMTFQNPSHGKNSEKHWMLYFMFATLVLQTYSQLAHIG